MRNPKLLGFKAEGSKRHGLQGRALGGGWHLAASSPRCPQLCPLGPWGAERVLLPPPIAGT